MPRFTSNALCRVSYGEISCSILHAVRFTLRPASYVLKLVYLGALLGMRRALCYLLRAATSVSQ